MREQAHAEHCAGSSSCSARLGRVPAVVWETPNLRTFQAGVPGDAGGAGPVRGTEAVDAAWELLQRFTARQAAGTAQPLLNSPAKRAALRAALLVRLSLRRHAHVTAVHNAKPAAGKNDRLRV